MMFRLFLLVSVLLVLPVDVFAEQVPIRIEGSTTMAPMMRRMIVAYRRTHPWQAFSLTASGSGSGVSALSGGRTDIAMLSRLMSEKEIADCREKGVDPERILVAMDGLSVVAHADNPVTGLTRRQLQSIYVGEITNWKAVGGPEQQIVPFGREAGSGSLDVWERKVMGMAPTAHTVFRVASNEVMARAVQDEPCAIGYVGLGFVNRHLHVMDVNGVAPTVETVLDGSYSLARTLNIYVSRDAPEDVRRFLDFVLGPAGRSIVEAEGFALNH